jgi:hypothetical protein
MSKQIVKGERKMNRLLLFLRKLMAWGNPCELKDLYENGKNMTWWESYGWGVKSKEKVK